MELRQKGNMYVNTGYMDMHAATTYCHLYEKERERKTYFYLYMI